MMRAVVRAPAARMAALWLVRYSEENAWLRCVAQRSRPEGLLEDAGADERIWFGCRVCVDAHVLVADGVPYQCSSEVVSSCSVHHFPHTNDFLTQYKARLMK